MLLKRILLLTSLVLSATAEAQPVAPPNATELQAPKEKKWYETISIRGYIQARYNRLAETNPQLKCEQCDRSWGENGGFFLRRARVIFFGQINKHVYFYLQPDFASSASSSSLHFGQIRDAYVDIGVDKHNEFRFRVGQSKVPFGFENMQSSQNRLPLDRNDGLNSALSNERDMGVFLYWAPTEKRKLFSSLVNDGLKGSGDYGVFAFGAFNGQTANKPEQNNELHYVARFTYPMKVGSQIIESSIQAYTGKYVVTKDQISSDVKTTKSRNYTDERVAATFVLYPKPFGITAEYNIGKGPEYDKNADSIEVKNLYGGYITMMYQLKIGKHTLFPYVRIQHYTGGKKFELDARSYKVNEWEAGVEWQPSKQFELVATYVNSARRFEDHVLKNNFQTGSLVRLQAQINF